MPKNLLVLPATKQKIAKLVILDAVYSTNDYVKEHIRELDPFSLVVTDNQTNGRGRQGRSWVSRRGEGLALSLVVPLPLASGFSWLPLVAGACLVHAVRAHGVPGASLKWPNDVLVNDKKLAGVLCETVGEGIGVVGVGINVSFPPENPPRDGVRSGPRWWCCQPGSGGVRFCGSPHSLAHPDKRGASCSGQRTNRAGNRDARGRS